MQVLVQKKTFHHGKLNTKWMSSDRKSWRYDLAYVLLRCYWMCYYGNKSISFLKSFSAHFYTCLGYAFVNIWREQIGVKSVETSCRFEWSVKVCTPPGPYHFYWAIIWRVMFLRRLFTGPEFDMPNSPPPTQHIKTTYSFELLFFFHSFALCSEAFSHCQLHPHFMFGILKFPFHFHFFPPFKLSRCKPLPLPLTL